MRDFWPYRGATGEHNLEGAQRRETQVTSTMQRVVVGVDGSKASQDALDWAVREAALMSRSLTVLHSYTVTVGSPPMDQVLREIGTAVLDAAKAHVRSRAPELVVESELHYGPPVPLLLERSKEAAVLVVGSRGTGSFEALMLGSVAVAVTAHAHCPVVVVRGTEGAPDQGAGSRVVVGVDGSAPATAAVEFAIAEASRRRLPLHALSAWQVPPIYGPTVYPVLVDERTYESESRAELSQQLAGWLETVSYTHLTLPTTPYV